MTLMGESRSDYFMAHLRARKALGPICGWCEASAREYEREYAIDHNAGADILQGADSQRVGCKAGNHVDASVFERLHRYPGNMHPRPSTGVA